MTIYLRQYIYAKSCSNVHKIHTTMWVFFEKLTSKTASSLQ